MDRETPNTQGSGNDPELAGRFARLRAAEAQSAPPLVSPQVTGAREGIRAGRWQRAVSGLVAASVLVAIALTLVNKPPEDPAELYASIMARQQLQTDILLQVSEGTLPAMNSTPGFYEPNIEWESESFIE